MTNTQNTCFPESQRSQDEGIFISVVNIGSQQTSTLFKPREGAEVDAKVYQELFENHIGFKKWKVEYKNLFMEDWNCKNYKKCTKDYPCPCCAIKEIGKRHKADLKGLKYLVLTISSHGCQKKGETRVKMIGGQSHQFVSMSEIYKALDIDDLKEVIKILFIQCCRMENEKGKERCFICFTKSNNYY